MIFIFPCRKVRDARDGGKVPLLVSVWDLGQKTMGDGVQAFYLSLGGKGRNEDCMQGEVKLNQKITNDNNDDVVRGFKAGPTFGRGRHQWTDKRR